MWPGEKKLKDIKVDRLDVRSMRKALREMEHHKTYVRAVADTARYHGLSGEDEYTVLAYELLLRNEQLEGTVLEYVNCSLRPLVLVPAALPKASAPNLNRNLLENALINIWQQTGGAAPAPYSVLHAEAERALFATGVFWPRYARGHDWAY